VGSHEPNPTSFVSGPDWWVGSLFQFECFLHLLGKSEAFEDIFAVHPVVVVVVLIILIFVELLDGVDF
jgi:hypothetical protein